MKQFCVMNPSTYVWRSVDEGELMSMMGTATDSLLAQWVPVGGEFTDSNGFQVARDADIGPGSADPRLEHIATAVLPWALSTRNPGSGWDEVAATLAVAAAKALIAELDKQA